MENKLPEGWEWKKLGEFSKIKAGGTPSRGKMEYWKDGTIPWVKITDMKEKYVSSTSEFITEAGLKNSSAKIIPKGTILISIFASLGEVGILDIDAACNQAIAGVQICDKNVDKIYLYYYLKNKKDHFMNIGRGVAQNNINQKILKETDILVPPLEIQQKIVSILEKAEETKKLRAQADELMQKLLQSVFLEMFGDPVTNSKNWDMTKIGDCTEFMTSGSRGWAKYYSDTGEKFIRIQNVKNGKLDFSDIQLVEPPKTAESIRTKVKDGDLLISITADLGRTAVVDEQTALEGAYINQHLALIRLNKKIVDPVFVSQYLESEGGKRQFSSLDQKGVKSGLNFESVRSLEFYLPPLTMQEEFSSLLEKLEVIWKNQIQSSLEINNLFDVLMQKAFTGELVS